MEETPTGTTPMDEDNYEEGDEYMEFLPPPYELSDFKDEVLDVDSYLRAGLCVLLCLFVVLDLASSSFSFCSSSFSSSSSSSSYRCSWSTRRSTTIREFDRLLPLSTSR